MPLDNAVYAPAAGYIYGVRGPYVYKLNATTGALVSSSRFCNVSFGGSEIRYDSVTGNLFVGVWNEPRDDDNSYAAYPGYRTIYQINATTLLAGDLVLWSTIGLAHPMTGTWEGPGAFIANNGKIYGLINAGNSYQIDVASMTGSAAGGGYSTSFWTDMVFDGTYLWNADHSTWGIYGYLPANWVAGFPVTHTVYADFSASKMPFSSCSVGSNLYACCRNPSVVKSDFADTTHSTIATGVALAKPFRIRYCSTVGNPFNGLILLPGYDSDSVIVINPTTDTVTNVKTGFDLPFDVVFTATKVWAVQHGSVGLKEIT